MLKAFRRLLWVFSFALLLRACVLEPVRTQDDAMLPQIFNGDIILVSKLSYGLRVPGAGTVLLEWQGGKKGDLVVVAAVGDPPMSLLRRVSSVAGDSVQYYDRDQKRDVTVELKPGEFFLSSDQKENSLDSRNFGIVPRRAIIGKATHIWIPTHQNASSSGESQVQSRKGFSRFFQRIL